VQRILVADQVSGVVKVRAGMDDSFGYRAGSGRQPSGVDLGSKDPVRLDFDRMRSATHVFPFPAVGTAYSLPPQWCCTDGGGPNGDRG
jgi:hypothetical protein